MICLAPGTAEEAPPRFLFSKRRLPFRLILLGWSLLCACGMLLICSKSSPFYPMNDWVDVQCFFTVGRGILQGKMPYLDLYEQKGPVLYLLFALAALVSAKSFWGVFLLEVLCLGVFLFESARIGELLAPGPRWPLFLLPPVLSLLVAVSPAFSHGGSAEELFLPALALFLRVTLQSVQEDRPLKRREAFLCGILAALGLWVKYTFCGLFAGGAAALLLWYLLTRKARALGIALLYGALGILAVTAPLLLWFYARGALTALWQVYFVNNLTAYASGTGARHAGPLAALLKNWMWSAPAAAGCLWLWLRPGRRPGQGFLVLCAAVCLGLFTYANGRTYPYYALILSVFAGLGFEPLVWLLQKLPLQDKRGQGLLAGALSLGLLAGCLVAGYRQSGNVYLMAYEKEDMPQYRFAQLLREDPEATLLNLGFLDGGFYLASGVEPGSRFFCTFNIRLAQQDEEHDRLIQQGQVKYIVVRGKQSPGRNYTLIDQCSFPFEGRNWTYSLYRLSDQPAERTRRRPK